MKILNREKVLEKILCCQDELNARNKSGIEKYRKGNFTIRFTQKGNKKVSVRQIRHKFLFGSTGFMLGCFENAEKETKFKELFASIFNLVVVPFYWNTLEPEEGKLRFQKDSENIYRRPAPDTVLEFCRNYGIEPKGHCLTWNWMTPDWLKKYSPNKRKKILERRFSEIAEEYADKIPSFDIVNESASNYRYGRDSLFENYDEFSLRLGKKYFPNNKKIINETNQAIWYDYMSEGKYMSFNMQLKDFIRRRLPIDEIGLQYHIFIESDQLESDGVKDAFLNAKYMLEILDLYDRFNLPMHISEITIPSYVGRIVENEELQAEIAKIWYETWFATRNMKSIVWWNLADGYAAYAPMGTDEGENRYGGGLVHFDMSKKPAYNALDKLINHEWKTSEEIVTDACEFTFRGFYGEYEVEVENADSKNKKTVNFDSDGVKISI